MFARVLNRLDCCPFFHPRKRLAHSGNLTVRWLENGPTMNESMYFLFKMGIFQPAMFVYRRVVVNYSYSHL